MTLRFLAPVAALAVIAAPAIATAKPVKQTHAEKVAKREQAKAARATAKAQKSKR